jgi:hypothetical protein
MEASGPLFHSTFLKNILMIFMNNLHIEKWDSNTMLYPMRSLDFSNVLILPNTLWSYSRLNL